MYIYIYIYIFQGVVKFLNYRDLVKVGTMKPYQFLDYDCFFKSLYNVPQSVNINITHNFVADKFDRKL